MKGAFCMPQKQKMKPLEKEKLVKRFECSEISLSEAAYQARVDRGTVRYWIALYRSEGSGCFAESKTNRVYSPELKQQAVLAYLCSKGSLQKICEIFHIRSKNQLRTWLKVYNSGKGFRNKMSGGSRMKSTRKTTQEERIQIVKECIESDNNYGLVAQKHSVSYQQARTWTLKYKELGETGLEDRRGQNKRDQSPRTEVEQAQIEIEKLKRQLYFAEMENNVLKKLQEIERRDALDK